MRFDIKTHLCFLSERLEETERQLQKAVEESPIWHESQQLPCSVPGVGPNTARTLLAEFPELRRANCQEIAKLVGVAPLNCDSGTHNSGTHRGERKTWGGRARADMQKYLSGHVIARREDDAIHAFQISAESHSAA